MISHRNNFWRNFGQKTARPGRDVLFLSDMLAVPEYEKNSNLLKVELF